LKSSFISVVHQLYAEGVLFKIQTDTHPRRW